MNVGRVVEARRRSSFAMPRPRPAKDLERKLRAAEKELAAAEAALEQAKADERDLGTVHVDHHLGTISPADYDRRIADVQRRLVESRHDVDRWTAIEAGVREKAVEAVIAANEAEVDGVVAERARLEHDRERLLEQIGNIDRRDADLAAKQAAIEEARLPALARFDEDAAERLAAREKAIHDDAVQLAHARLRGEEVEVPENLARLVRDAEQAIRAGAAEQERERREHFRLIGTVPLASRSYDDFDPDGVRRDADVNLGFADDLED